MLANKKKIFDLVNQSKYLFTSGYGYVDPKNTKNSKFAPRVSDNIVWININNFGQFERVAAFVGESLLTTLQRYKVNNVPATCQGGEDLFTILEKPIDPYTYGPFCTACHVIIADPWRQQMGQLHVLEERNLEESEQPVTQNSRLACCMTVESWMNEMIVTIGQNTAQLEDE